MPRTKSCISPAAPTGCAASAGPPASQPSKPVSPILSGPPREPALPLPRLRRRRGHAGLRRLPRLLPGPAVPRGLPPLPLLRAPPAAPPARGRGRLLRALPDPREEVASLRRAPVARHERALLRRAAPPPGDADRGLRVRGWGVSGDVGREGF